MKTHSDFMKKMRTTFGSISHQVCLNITGYPHQVVKQKSYNKAPANISQPRYTVVVLDCSTGMNSTDYYPTRRECVIREVGEYMKVRAKQYNNETMALVCCNSKERITVYPIGVDQLTISCFANDVVPRANTDIAGGLRWAANMLKKQSECEYQRHVIVVASGWSMHSTRRARKLKKRYRAVISVVGLGSSRSELNEPLLRQIATTDADGFNHYHLAKTSEGLMEHFRQLAACRKLKTEMKQSQKV